MSDWTANLRALGKGAAKDVQDVLRAAQAAGGWTGRRLKNGHVMLRHAGGATASIPATPSDYRSIRNARAQIKRGGAK